MPNSPQLARLLEAVKALPGRGPHLYAFFGCMYYAAMRPAEVIMTWRRAGQSIRVLFRYYAEFLAEARHHANRLIEDSMQRWDEREGP
ncbi:hypothetical protein OG422_29465 [Streptomyces sp. NBC_01525]|uniref:hypothetical protein n=1 Tax=Streptomyces sp. NBC_01525 TaxID=2903893 RepID=UPI0038653C12